MSTGKLNSIAARTAPCKCCGTESGLFGVVDFHKNCEQRNRQVLELSGIPIYYYRCPRCGFVFATAFDSFSPEDFGHYIYNEEYARVDPEFLEFRPAANAKWAAVQFGGTKPARILDYGGGNGLFARRLRESGFENVESYDPFVSEHAARPTGKFDCIFSFEVMEHSCQPAQTMADMASSLDNPGIIIFSTVPQPESFATEQLNWWYVAPRNGHVSIFTVNSLQILTANLGLKYGVFKHGCHVACNEIPEFFRYLVREQK